MVIKYNGLLHTTIFYDGITYYHQIFTLNEFFYKETDEKVTDENIISILSKKTYYKKKLTNLIFKIDSNIQDRRINELYKRFPKGSFFYAYSKLYTVEDIICNKFMSSEHYPDYELDRLYSITPKRVSMQQEEKYYYNIPECETLQENRLKKLKRIIE